MELETLNVQLILPVAGAIVLVVLVFAFGVGLTSSAEPPLALLELDSHSDADKKQKVIKKKQKASKKEKLTNGNATPSKESSNLQSSVEDKQLLSKKNDSKKIEKKKVVKDLDAKAEKIFMKRDAAQGDWKVVTSRKERPSKQKTAADKEEPIDSKSEEISKTGIEPALVNDTNVDKEAEKCVKDTAPVSDDNTNKSANKLQKNSGDSVSAKGSRNHDSKSQDSKKHDKKETEINTSQKASAEVVKKEPAQTSSETERDGKTTTTQATVADDNQPLFNEMDDWEAAKPLKMKKRARRER